MKITLSIKLYTVIVLLLLVQAVSATAGEVLYEDNFSRLDPSWGRSTEQVSVKDGKLILKPVTSTTQSVLNQANVFDNADISIEVSMPAGDTNVAGGLIFWANDYTNFYCVCIDARGRFKVSRFVADRWLQPVEWVENNAIKKGIGQVNRLRVVTRGREATVYINDQQVTTFNGQPPQGGGCIGVCGGSAHSGENTWQFGNLRVVAIQASTALSTKPAAQASSAAAETSQPTADTAPTPLPARQPVSGMALRLHGSNTIGKELIPALCEEFFKYEGATSVQRKPRQKEDETDVEAVLPKVSSNRTTFEVEAHGSKMAFEDLAAGKCDICMASRQIKEDEARRCTLAGLGDMFSPGCQIVLGLDGVAVFVNKSNPVNALTKKQLADIFSGRVTDWSQVGGSPGPIDLYAGDDGSDDFDTFKALVLGGMPLSSKASRYENSAKLSDEVATDTNGIGFAGMTFIRGCKPLAVSEAGKDALLPTPFTVTTGRYLLSRRFFLYIPAHPQNEWTQNFVDFAVLELGGSSNLTPSGFFARKFVEVTTTKLEVFSWWTSGGEAAALDALFECYEKQYPGAGVINATVAGGSGSAARPVLQTRLAVGNPPDTWQSHPGWELLGQYVEPNYCEPVTDLYKSDGWNTAFPRALIDMISNGGQIYAVLTGVHRGNVLWYNKKLLERNGIKVGDKMTFDEFFADCDKLKAAGIAALGVGDSGIWASAQLFENTLLGVIGPQGWTDLFNGKMKWDDPRVEQAMQYFAKMQNYLNPDHASLTWDEAVKELIDGKVAFTSMGDWADGEFIKAGMKENEDFGWVSSPGTDGCFTIVADGFTLAKGAPHKEATIAWLKTIGSKEAQQAFNSLKGSIPARTDLDKSKFDAYHQWSMSEFAKDKLLPSCVHGEAAPASFQDLLNNAVTAFVVDKNVQNFAGALVQATEKTGPEAVAMPDFGGQAIKLEYPEIPPNAPSRYANAVIGAERLSVDLQFRAGTFQLDDDALQVLNRLAELLANPIYQERKLLVFGFSDSAGNTRRNLGLSRSRANAVAEQLHIRGLKPWFVGGFGKQLAIASNDTEEGREKNRRVEIWLR
jgi:glucose/mannose transport system substrate-binding protein